MKPNEFFSLLVVHHLRASLSKETLHFPRNVENISLEKKPTEKAKALYPLEKKKEIHN